MSESVGPPSPARIRDAVPRGGERLVLGKGTRLMRLHPLGGPHPVAWNAFRAWGPTGGRFDHQPPPPRTHRRRRVAYFAYGNGRFVTAIAECFQDANGGVGPVQARRRGLHVSELEVTRDLVLVDLASGWVTRAGGNQALCSGPRQRAQQWARCIYEHHKDRVDGLAYPSSVWPPGRCVVLWERAESALPASPRLHRALDASELVVPLASACEDLGTYLV